MPNSVPSLILGPPVEKPQLQRVVYERLRHVIVTGRIEPGQQLKIGELAASLNVSANPVREALRQLEAEGMVSFRPDRRIVVNKLTREDLYDIYSLVIPLEEMSLQRGLKSLNAESFQGIAEIYQLMIAPDITDSEWIELNRTFHHRIHELTGSPRLVKILGGLHNNITPYLYLALAEDTRMKQANAEHGLLLEALRKRDLAEATRILSLHLENGCQAIDRLMQQNK
ncbi:MAG: GntR family transcriptional regulator [Desulfarculus sp.]|jgi:DNA-binding GntR family transcriptional regulator|nr:MAG: GntR family transcriptional regulator [Desulfarculus sp.]